MWTWDGRWLNDQWEIMKRIPESSWAEIRTAYASGIGLRELARNLNIPAGTILARSKREGWTRQIQSAKALAARPPEAPTVTPTQAAAFSMQQRGERHIERVAGIVERGIGHVEGMETNAILDRVDEIEKLDRIGRRTFGINEGECLDGIVNIAIINFELPAAHLDQARES